MDQSATAALAEYFDKHIPLVRAMGVSIDEYSDRRLTLAAPLAPNVNDKGTAFGGSLNAVMTLCGWGLIWLDMRQHEVDHDLVIHRAEQVFTNPVRGSFKACAQATESAWQEFYRRLEKGRRAALEVNLSVLDPKAETCAAMTARYVALP